MQYKKALPCQTFISFQIFKSLFQRTLHLLNLIEYKFTSRYEESKQTTFNILCPMFKSKKIVKKIKLWCQGFSEL